MERSEILAVILKHIERNVDGAEDIEIDPTKSMLEQGASSLDVVEIVSASMRELKVKVARTELAKLKNIDELVDLFYEIKNNPAPVEAAEVGTPQS